MDKFNQQSKASNISRKIPARNITSSESHAISPSINSSHMSSDNILQLQETLGNRATRDILDGNNIQRETKRTEKRILNDLGNGGGLTNNHMNDLVDKMDKGQDFAHARKIAKEIETESETLVSQLNPQDEQDVRAAIRNYVSSSTAIQQSARNDPNAVSQNVQNLDAALQAIRQQIQANNQSNERIVYRSISYDSGADIPYGQQANGQQIDVGDFVGDLGFLSTSEHRQFVLGKEQTGNVQGLLKMAIYGKSGVPIAIQIPTLSYTNPNQKALFDMNESKKNQLTQTWNKAFGKGPMAGQAEILFPRNTVFEVKKIQRDGNFVSVVVEEVTGQRPNNVKNMKFGTAL